MVTIRLSRGGATKRAFYHIVVADSRRSRDGRYLERIGFFNPTATADEPRVKIDLARIDHWCGHGAKMSDRVAYLVKQFRVAAAA